MKGTNKNKINVSGIEDELISRETLFASTSQKQNVQLSSNGEYVSYIASYKGTLNVWIAPVNDISKAKCVTRDNGVIKTHLWSQEGK